MFLPKSRYAAIPTVDATDRSGRPVQALKLRVPPQTSGTPYQVRDGDRLDLIAQDRLADATRFWRVADANTARDARTLTEQTGTVIVVPDSD